MNKKIRDTAKLGSSATKRGVKFINTIIEKSGKSRRKYADEMDVDHQKLTYYINDGKAMRKFVAFLAAFRKKSGLSWSKFGKMLDDEFLE